MNINLDKLRERGVETQVNDSSIDFYPTGEPDPKVMRFLQEMQKHHDLKDRETDELGDHLMDKLVWFAVAHAST
ncbi:MAG: hypothetical protein ACYTEQ_22490 [Planctomycetota bacterium]|jgi:hypothetical protein